MALEYTTDVGYWRYTCTLLGKFFISVTHSQTVVWGINSTDRRATIVYTSTHEIYRRSCLTVGGAYCCCYGEDITHASVWIWAFIGPTIDTRVQPDNPTYHPQDGENEVTDWEDEQRVDLETKGGGERKRERERERERCIRYVCVTIVNVMSRMNLR